LRIPKVRDGSYFPSLLEPHRRSEKALLAAIQQAYVEGVSTRRVDDLLGARGLEHRSGRHPPGRTALDPTDVDTRFPSLRPPGFDQTPSACTLGHLMLPIPHFRPRYGSNGQSGGVLEG
jgi:hypothetical protein